MDKNTLSLAKKIVDAINSKSATSIQVLDVHELTTLTEIFIIAVASNTRQTQAISDAIEKALTDDETSLLQKESGAAAQWILLDYGIIIVHVLYKEDAAFYALDRLWKDAKVITFS